MRSVGIVGSEGAKFTSKTEEHARGIIRGILAGFGSVGLAPNLVVSGECHLGGIDIWAKEEAKRMGLDFLGFPPKSLSWSGGYKPRNMQIVRASDEVHCITVAKLPESYDGMRFPLCYHCKTDEHVKSGGCWTMLQARKLGKPGVLHVI